MKMTLRWCGVLLLCACTNGPGGTDAGLSASGGGTSATGGGTSATGGGTSATGGGTSATGGGTSATGGGTSATGGGTSATGGGTSATGGGTSATGGGIASTANSIQLTLGAARTDPEGVAPQAPKTHRITWKDARGADRAAVLYGYLYQYDFTFLGGVANPATVTTRSANDDAWGHPGFGYVVSHNTQTGNSPLGKANAPTAVQTTLFSGAHHAIHRIELVYDRDQEGGGNGIKIPVVIEWFVATGHDHPVWAVTYKMGSVTNPGNTNFDTYRMDTRGPYGALNFDGAATKAAGDAIGGVSWGDFALAFRTTDAQLTLTSPWTYTTANTVNFTRAWTATTNSEMGIVQTKPQDKTLGYPDRVLGRERGSTSALAYTNKGDCTGLSDARVYSMPCVAGWPYQLMNFDWDPSGSKPAAEATGTKLMAWGSPYGWLGASSFDLFDYSGTTDGRGDRSYSTFIVLGPKCRYDNTAVCNQPGDVQKTLDEVDALTAATLTPTVGTLVTTVPKGPGASQTKPITNGYDDTYAVYTLQAQANQLTFTITPGAKPLHAPIFRVRGYTASALPSITVNAAAISVNTGANDAGAFASLDPATHELWVTLNRTVTAATAIHLEP